MNRTERARSISRRRIFAGVASLALLATCGSAHAGPYDQGAAQFIRLMEKQAAGNLASAVGVNAARGLAVMNPAVALGTTALSLYLLACSSQFTDPAGCAGSFKIAIKPSGAPEDRQQTSYNSPPSDLGPPAIQTVSGAWVEGIATSNGASPPHYYARSGAVDAQGMDPVAIATSDGAWLAAHNPGYAYCANSNNFQGNGVAYSMGTFNGGSGSCTQYAWNVQFFYHCDVVGPGYGLASNAAVADPQCVSSAPTCAPGQVTLGNGHCGACPPGTSFSGGVCVGQILQPDGVNRIKAVSPGNWSPMPSSDVDAPPANAVMPANPVVYTGVDAFGNKQRISIKARADGGVDVEIATEAVAGGSSVTQFNQATVNSDGSVNEKVFTKTGTISDQGSPNTATPPTPAPVAPVVVNVTTPPLTLPTDYARENTQQANNAKLTSIDTTLKTGVKVDETGTPTGGDFSASDTAADSAKAAAQTLATTATDATGKDTTWGFSLNLPSGCTNPAGIVVPNWHLNWVPDMCQFSDRIQAVTGFLWILLTLGSCLSMVRQTVSGGA